MQCKGIKNKWVKSGGKQCFPEKRRNKCRQIPWHVCISSSCLLYRDEIPHGEIHSIWFLVIWQQAQGAYTRKRELTSLWRRKLMRFVTHLPMARPQGCCVCLLNNKIPGRYILLMCCSHPTTLQWAEMSINNTWKEKLILKCTKHLYWEQTGRLNPDFSRSLSFCFAPCLP